MPDKICRTIALYTKDPLDSAVVNIRVVGPASASGLHIVYGNRSDDSSDDAVSQADFIIIQRNFPGDLSVYEQVIERARSQGKPVVYELDDLLFELPAGHPARQAPDYRDAIMPMLQAVVEADAVTASTIALSDYLRFYNPKTWVIPNYLNDGLWTLKAPVTVLEERPLIIGYMGGGTHGPDLEMAVPALLNILKKYRPAVTLRFWGGEPPASLVHEPDVSWTPINLIDYAEFAQYASQQDCDIVIAPLADNQFNRCKSAIKFLEYSALGWPGVYSRIDPYSSVVIHGENGFLAATPEEWEKCLTHLIDRPVDRGRLARRAMQTVQHDWLLSKNAGRWQDTYQKIMADYAPTRSSSPAVQVAKHMQRQHLELQSELVENVKELNNRVWALNGLVAEKDHDVQTLASIQSSLSWQMMMAVWKSIATLAPPNSRREKFLRTTAGVILRRLRAWVNWLKRLQGGPKRQTSAPTTYPKNNETPSLQPVVDVPPIFKLPRLLTTRRFRVLYITVDQNLPSHRYRVDNYREYLGSIGVYADVIQLHRLVTQLHKLPRYDIVVIFRAVYDDLLAQAYAICQRAGIPIVYDIDDYIFDAEIVTEKYVDGIRFLSAANQQAYAEAIPKYRQALLEADYCTVSTPYLADRCRELGKTTFVLANGLNREVMRLSADAYRTASVVNDEICLGYFSGTKTHQRDFAVAVEPIARLMSENVRVKLVIVGELDLQEFPTFQPFADRIELRPVVPWPQLPGEIARVDINVVPLEIGNPYCEAKSDLKYFESAAVKVPTVASATGIFRAAIHNGKTGFLAANSDEWYAALQSLVADERLRRDVARQAQTQVLNAYDPVSLGVTARSVYWSILKLHRARLNRAEMAMAISFVLPPFLQGSGGHNKTLAIARGLAMRGHEVRLYIDGTDVEIAASLTLLRRTGHLDYARFGGSISDLVTCDALIATHWRTAYLVKAMADFAARSFYFVQDYEPYFYPMGESYIRADHSYDLGLFIISYGAWCLKEIESRHKCAGDVVPYFIDQEQYDAAPANWRERNKILFFARPDMERRCYYMGVQALDQLHRRLDIKEKGFEIVIFGSEKPVGSLPFPHSNLGVVSPAQLAELYRSARLGLALSTTNMSMVSYEMMACGCPIVDFDIHNNAEMYGGRENVFLAEPDPEHIAHVMVNALTNHEQAQQVAERAYQFTRRFPVEVEVIAAFEKIVTDEVRHRTSA